VEQPEIALAVFIKHGGTEGAPAVRAAQQILEHYFKTAPAAEEAEAAEAESEATAQE
jgi:cell division protein FtsI/penicillin-binding protein 2